MIESLLFKKSFDEAVSLLKKLFIKNKIDITLKKRDLEDALSDHLKYAENLTKSISFRDLLNHKNLHKIYINLDIHLSPKRLLPINYIGSHKKIEEVLNGDYHTVILGDPGAGKTTGIKNLTQKLLHGEDELLKQYNFPIIIQLRDLNEEESLFQKLSEILGLKIAIKEKNEISEIEIKSNSRYLNIVCQYIDTLTALILIDGLDELNDNKQKEVIKELRILCNSLNNSRVLLTCRSGSYDIAIENTNVYEICSLNKNQVNFFIEKWFDNKEMEFSFNKELEKATFKDFAIRPLTLSHLCALFEKYKRLPDKPKYIYKKLIYLLLEDWDIERDIVRESKYYNFETERKYEFLANLAYELTIYTNKKRFSEDELINNLKKFSSSFNIKNSELLNVIGEIESHNGIFIKSSYETYEFSHKSMQEYLTAYHLIRKGSIPYDILYKKDLSNELAIAVSLASAPNNDYLYKIIFGFFLRSSISKRGISEFLRRVYIEKPDFSESPFLAFSIIFLYHYYYFNPEILSKNNYNHEEINQLLDYYEGNFYTIFNELLTLQNFARSFRGFYKLITKTIIKNDNILLVDIKQLKKLPEFNIPEVRTLEIPDFIYVNSKYIIKV